jgi:CubicO group peptidase (beta-lactamase class C family)
MPASLPIPEASPVNVRCSAAPARARAFALCCLTAASGPYGAAAQSPPAGRDSADAFITGYMEEHRVPGIAAAIVADGLLEKTRGYGLANVEHSVPVTAETIFQSGSLGKQFTAAAVLLLAEDGRLSLDDPITDHLREAPASWDAVTIRHLLTHTAGLPDYEDWLDFRRDYEEEELVRGIGERPRVFEPGTAWSYSNSGYLVLGALVSRLSGAHWSEVLQERVFAPAGMETARVISEAEIVPHRSSGYRMEGGRLLNQESVSPTLLSTGDGALYFTILDLVKWDQALRSGAILSAASRRAMWQPTRLTDGAEVRTGSAAPGPPAAAPMNRADAPKRPIFATNPRRPRPSNPNASPADGGEGGGG